MTLTPEYQYLGRSAALKSQSGSYSYYLLLYGASSGLVASGNHHVSIKLRLACTEASSFYGFATAGAASAGGQSAFSWSWEMNPNAPWNTTALTEGGVTYPSWIDLRENAVRIYTGYGAQKTVDLSGSFTFLDGTSGYLPEKNKTVTVTVSCVLPAIAGASKPSCAATCQLGSPLAITISGQSGLTHTLRYRFGSAEGVIDGNTWTPPLELAHQIPNADFGTATISCDTYSGSQPIGTEQTTVTLTVPASVVPTVSAAISDASGAEGVVKCLVQNYSKLKVVPNAQGIYSSTIRATAVLLDGKAYTGGILTESGSHTLAVTATDSRGRTASFEKSISVAAYTAPTLKLSASRCTADGTADEAGGYAKITVTGAITELAGNNKAALTLYWGSNHETVESPNFSKIVEADVNATMAIRATLSDKLITTERSMTLSTGYATLDLLAGGKGIAFGKAATREGFDCAMPAFFTGGVSGIEASDVGAAPSGFGLGAQSVTITDCNATWRSGFYRWDTKATGGPFSYAVMLVIARGDGACTQLVFGAASSNAHMIARRRGNANTGEWQEWEFLNPRMVLGTPYRTIYRHKDKSVYDELISFGTLPSSGSKTKDTGLAFATYEPVGFDLRLIHSSGSYIYSHVPGLTFGFQKGTTNWELAATVTENLSAYTAEVLIHYVKKG